MLLDKVLNYIFVINIAGFALVFVYAIALSKMLVSPVETLSSKLSNMNENSLATLDLRKLPVEFEPLAISINSLTTRIESYVKYTSKMI